MLIGYPGKKAQFSPTYPKKGILRYHTLSQPKNKNGHRVGDPVACNTFIQKVVNVSSFKKKYKNTAPHSFARITIKIGKTKRTGTLH